MNLVQDKTPKQSDFQLQSHFRAYKYILSVASVDAILISYNMKVKYIKNWNVRC